MSIEVSRDEQNKATKVTIGLLVITINDDKKGFEVYNDAKGDSFYVSAKMIDCLFAAFTANDIKKTIRMFALTTPELRINDQELNSNTWYELTRMIDITLDIKCDESLGKALAVIPNNLHQLITQADV